MKNNMKLIMESWRSSPTLNEVDAHSNDYISRIKVSEFLEALKEENNDVLNSNTVQKAINGAMKHYANEIAELEGEEKSKLDAMISKVVGQGSIDVIADAAAELSGDAVKQGGALAMGTAIGLGVAGGWVAVGGAVLIYAGSKAVKHVTKKGIKMATDIGGALEDLDVPDQNLQGEPALHLIDISDDYKKVIVGADGKLDKKEAAVLAIGFKSVASAFNKIQEKIAAIDAMPGDTVEDMITQTNEFNALMDEPMTAYISNTATEAARKAYSKMLKLQRNVTINQN
jgi:hypothetical protein